MVVPARQRDVEVLACPGALAGLVGPAEEVRVVAVRVGVDRDVADVAAAPEDLLAAVAVVVVDVEDRDPLAGRPDDRLGRDRGVVEEAVAAVHRARGVVAGRTAQAVRGRRAPEHEVRPWSARRPRPPGRRRTCRRPAAPPSRVPRTRPGRRRGPARGRAPRRPRRTSPRTSRGWGTCRRTGTAGRSAVRRSSDQATSRKRTRPGSWTAVIGASPCSVGPTIGKPPSASRAARIRSARSATSLAGTGIPMNVSTVMSWPRWAGE